MAAARRDVFICHSSEDKHSIVRPLVTELLGAGISVWYDEAEIAWGDSITARINEGLRISSYVIVVFTQSLLTKNWPQWELNAALNLEIQGNQTKILPLVCGDSQVQNTVFERYPLLKNKRYLVWRNSPSEITAALRVQLLRAAKKQTEKETGIPGQKIAAQQEELEKLLEVVLSQASMPVRYQPICELGTSKVVGLEALCCLFLSVEGPVSQDTLLAALRNMACAEIQGTVFWSLADGSEIAQRFL